MNTKKLLNDLEAIEDLITYTKEYIEEGDVAQAIDTLSEVPQMTDDVVAALEKQEDAIEDE